MTKALRINFNVFAASVALGATIVLSFLILSYARAETATSTNEAVSHGIVFPIPELGNCASKDECRAYCDDQGHMDACISFAKAHGLMNKDEADRAEKFRQDLQNGAGPGGCASPRDCRAFCSDVKNIEVCLKFAEDHGVKDENVNRAQKLLDYVKSGGQTPGGCASEASCKEYCGDFSHAEECFNFAKKIGIVQQGRGPGGGENNNEGNGPSADQMQKFLDLAKSGQTPGGCKTKDECESYCGESSHRDECLAFATKIGAITQDQADKARQSGMSGPGGCSSPDACAAYCNDQAHQEECFKFAEDRGFVKPEEAKIAKGGFTRIRAGLEQAPPEVAECLKSTVGENVLDDIQFGKLTPGPEIGQSVKSCFEKFGRKSDSTSTQFRVVPGQGGSIRVFNPGNLPQPVAECLKNAMGEDVFGKLQSGTLSTSDIGPTLKVCYQKYGGGIPGQHPSSTSLPPNGMPERMAECLKQVLGDEGIQNLKLGTPPSPEIMAAIMKCKASSNGGEPPIFNQKPYYQSVPSFSAPTTSDTDFQKVCDYPAPPQGYHYEGGDPTTHCGARIVKDQVPPTNN